MSMCIKLYLYRLEIGLSNFIKKFIRYQIFIHNIDNPFFNKNFIYL